MLGGVECIIRRFSVPNVDSVSPGKVISYGKETTSAKQGRLLYSAKGALTQPPVGFRV